MAAHARERDEHVARILVTSPLEGGATASWHAAESGQSRLVFRLAGAHTLPACQSRLLAVLSRPRNPAPLLNPRFHQVSETLIAADGGIIP